MDVLSCKRTVMIALRSFCSLFQKIIMSSFILGLFSGSLGSFCLFWLLKRRIPLFLASNHTRKMENISDDLICDPGCTDADDEYKMVLVVRNDLKMGKGKVAAQCSHAALGCFVKAMEKCPDVVARWDAYGQPKVVLKCNDEIELNGLRKAANQRNLINCIIRDAGKTQVTPGCTTVLGIGPAFNERVPY